MTSGTKNPLRWSEYADLTIAGISQSPVLYPVWAPGAKCRTNLPWTAFKLATSQYVPAILLYILAKLQGRTHMWDVLSFVRKSQFYTSTSDISNLKSPLIVNNTINWVSVGLTSAVLSSYLRYAEVPALHAQGETTVKHDTLILPWHCHTVSGSHHQARPWSHPDQETVQSSVEQYASQYTNLAPLSFNPLSVDIQIWIDLPNCSYYLGRLIRQVLPRHLHINALYNFVHKVASPMLNSIGRRQLPCGIPWRLISKEDVT